MDGVIKRPKIRYCSISDPFVLIIREDDSIGLFVGNGETGKIRRKDMTAMGEKVGAIVSYHAPRIQQLVRFRGTAPGASSMTKVACSKFNKTPLPNLVKVRIRLERRKTRQQSRWSMPNVDLSGSCFVGLKVSSK